VCSIDLDSGVVRRIAGTGEQGAWGGIGGAARETALSSPWDLSRDGKLLFIAMAGTHQVWLLDLERSLSLAYAGSGREARVDGGAEESAFAQPSGLTLGDENTLYVADAESNIIRAISLPPVNTVKTLAGGDLFEFGDKDGKGDAVRLQHPLGVAWMNGRLYIADTYNHRIKMMTPGDAKVTSFAGTGESGHVDGPAKRARFYEPGGVSATSKTLFVADTNNHAIRTIRLADGVVETLNVRL